MTINDRLLAAAKHWSDATGRSIATLATRVANDGKLFDRLGSGRTLTTGLAERFFAFFREPANWSDASVPDEVGQLLDGVDLGVAHGGGDSDVAENVSPGKADDVTARVAA